MPNATWLRPAILASLTATAAAQAPLNPYWPQTQVRTWADKANHPGNYGRMISTQITNFGYPDAVFLVGNEIMLMTAPALLFDISPLPGTSSLSANDLCSTVSANTERSIAMCGESGLRLWTNGSPYPAFKVPGTTWYQATSVRHVRGADELVGMNAAGDAVVRANLVTGTELSPWPIAGLLAVTAFDFDSDGTDEVGIVTTAGIQVRKLDGTTVMSFVAAITAAETERLPLPIGDAMTCLLSLSNTSNQFLVNVHSLWQEARPLLAKTSCNLTVADFNTDGWYDTSFSSTTATTFDALFNLGALQQPWFEYLPRGGVEVLLPHNTQVTPNPAPPLMADYNGDGQTDSIIPLQASGKISLGNSPFAPGNLTAVKYSGVYIRRYGGQTGPRPTKLEFDVSHTAIPSNATHLQLQAYKWDVLGGTDPQYSADLQLDVPCTTASPIYEFDSPWMADTDVFDAAVLFVLRYVRIEAGDVVHAWPPTSGSVTANTQIQEALIVMPGFLELAGGIGGVPTGGVTTITEVPPVEPPTGFEEDDGGE